MTKTNLVKRILDDSQIHHNISTLGLKLKAAPDDAPDDIFWDTCNMLVSDFCGNWLYEPRNDSGNRNLCGCAKLPSNMSHTNNGACKKHDFWHCYTTDRTNATLYWDKYWKESQGHYAGFKYDKDELEEMKMSELLEIDEDVRMFNKAVTEMMLLLPIELEYRYKEWAETDKEEKRKDALGYNKTLGMLLEDKNPAIIRLAKGIKKELNK